MSSDEVLEYLVQKTEETGIGMTVTLSMNGLIISGQIIRSKQYYEEMSNFLDSGEIKSTNEQDIKTFSNYIESYKQFIEQIKIQSQTKISGNPKYIHLSNATIQPSDSEYSIPAPLWRGKLSSVDGFSIGKGTITVHKEVQ